MPPLRASNTVPQLLPDEELLKQAEKLQKTESVLALAAACCPVCVIVRVVVCVRVCARAHAHT